ncbi:MAG TPA: cysteine desulfurase-like protein [Longimicrobiales bacterium]|nr:cysteine desulfurase-like protein [Longimicrobiales bacterium]
MNPRLAANPLSSAAIRAAFPALRRADSGAAVAYFDGPGGTQVPTAVVDAVSGYLLTHNANTHWDYPTSRETDLALEAARGALADLVGGTAGEIAFGANMTTLTFHLARALGRGLRPGSTVLVTELDHHANVAPWRALAIERGVRVRVVRMDRGTARLDESDFAAALAEEPAVVALGAASNVLGTVTDVARWTGAAHASGALVFVDAVHYAAHALTDVVEFGCDFLACSAYKFYGPHVGVLWGRRELLERLDFPRLDPAPQNAPERAETGTQNHEGIVGAAAAVDFLAGLGGAPGKRRERLRRSFERLGRRSDELGDRLRAGLEEVPGVTVHGPASGPRTPTVSFTVAGRDARDVARWLADERALYLSHGDFYAPTIIDRFGSPPGGFVRAGCACYTTGEEVDRLVRAVGELATRGRAA